MSANIDQVFKAFADETRLRILFLLTNRKELCVCDIISVLKMGQSKVSRHLAYLKSAGLVEDRKEGLWSYYTLARPKSKFQKQIMNCLSTCFDEVDVLKKDAEVLNKSKLACETC